MEDAVYVYLANLNDLNIKVNLKAYDPPTHTVVLGVNKPKTNIFIYDQPYTLYELHFLYVFLCHSKFNGVFLSIDHITRTPPTPHTCSWVFMTYGNHDDRNKVIKYGTK